MINNKLVIAAVVGSVAAAAPGRAQSPDQAAFDALRVTTIGALPPLLTTTMLLRHLNGAQLGLRYGFVPGNGQTQKTTFNNGGITALFNLGQTSTATVTGGIVSPTCSGCPNAWTIGAGADVGIGTYIMGTTREAARLTFSIDGEIAYSKPRDESVTAASIGIPITFVPGGANGMKLVPWLTPAWAIGSVSHDATVFQQSSSSNGNRFMIGGGLGFYNPDTDVLLTVGFQHIVFTGAPTAIGFGLQLGGK